MKSGNNDPSKSNVLEIVGTVLSQIKIAATFHAGDYFFGEDIVFLYQSECTNKSLY